MLECPPLPDPAASRRMIETCVPHRITGRVSAVTGDTLELEGMTAPLGSICEVQTSSGQFLARASDRISWLPPRAGTDASHGVIVCG